MVRGRLIAAGTLVAMVTACAIDAPASPTPSPTTASATAPGATPSVTPTPSATPSSTPSVTPTPTPTPTPQPIRLMVVGDSLTSGAEAEIYEPGDYPEDSWLHYLGDGVEVAQVWAVPGTTTQDMLQAIEGPTEADTLVLMAGENDSDYGRPWEAMVADIQGIVEAAKPRRVLLVGPTPTDYDIPTALTLNASLAGLAKLHDWEFVDGSEGLKNADGGWREGMSDDGTHPNANSAPIIAATIEAALRR